MLSSVEQAFVGTDEKRAPLKTPAWEAKVERGLHPTTIRTIIFYQTLCFFKGPEFRKFLLTKLINAELAAYNSVKFTELRVSTNLL